MLYFFSHIDKVFDYIEKWKYVTKWLPIGTIWISWVPQKDYKDYHLHFAIQKNPFKLSKSWKYTEMDIMKWDWYFKNNSRESILKWFGYVFQK